MTAFQKAEAEGRGYFAQLYPNYKKDYSPEEYSWWDVSGYTVSRDLMDDSSQPYVAELKKRSCPSNEYDTVMMQVDKYESLMNYTLSTGIKTFYICFYPDKTLVFNVEKLDIASIAYEQKDLPKNTVENNGEKVKDVYYLPLSSAKVLNRGWLKMKNVTAL